MLAILSSGSQTKSKTTIHMRDNKGKKMDYRTQYCYFQSNPT